MDTRSCCPINDISNLEDAGSDGLTTFDPEPLPEASDVISTRATEDRISVREMRESRQTYLCSVVTPYAKNVSSSQERAGWNVAKPFQ